MEMFAKFNVGIGTTHADLLAANALALAARRGVDVEVVKVDESSVEVTVPGRRSVVASDWDNVRSLIG